jgi:hypothetical protein
VIAMQTFTRVYDSYAQAQQVVAALEEAGVPSADISLVANRNVDERFVRDEDDNTEAAVGAGIGAAVGGTAGLLAGLGMLAIPGLGPVVAAGWLAATAVGAVAGGATGGIVGALVVGALVDAGTSEADAHVYSESVRRGGTLVTVKTDFDAAEVQEILDDYEPVDPGARRKEYEAAGWKEYDPDAGEYEFDEEEIDRIRRPYRD